MLPDDSNYILYRLTWNPERGKYDKRPCDLNGMSLQRGQPVPRARRDQITVVPGTVLGYWLTPDARMFFIDLDECVDPATGELAPDAARLVAPFVAAGCLFEASSSGTGAHIIGSYTGELPPHSNKRPGTHSFELYVRDRGIALNLERATGTASVDATGHLLATLAEWFPPRAVTVSLPVGERRPEWCGPEDDDELIRRALAATGSVAARMGGKASFGDLWHGKVELNNESDMALASHLAFWTGCDVARIERLMRRSGLKRKKWDEHRTYLRELTITQACATTRNVYQEPQRKDVVTEVVGGADYYTLTDDTIAAVNNTGTFKELMEHVVPGIGELALPHAHAERVVRALSKRLELFDAKLPIGAVRQLVTPPTLAATSNDTPPDWFAPFCYVRRTETYFNTFTGTHFTADNFRTEFSRYMPYKANGGQREDPVQYARERWNVPTVDDTVYRPDCDTFFDWGGKQFANEYLPSSLPALTPPSADCVAAIQAFQNHLYLICNHRDDLYITMLQWIAHNAQHPGRKIRWSPIIKGIPGDGKSIVSDLMRAVLGIRNVKMTSISNLSNTGGFTDWATGAAVNFIEEIQLTGRERYRLFNAMKTYIADNYIDLNRKGRAAGDTVYNVTNHWANTNYGDALPLDDGDRRWCVVFTPYATIGEAAAAKGLVSADDLVRHFKWLGTSMRSEPGAWRGWVMGIDTSSFDPDGRAPHTGEKHSMKLMSQDALDQAVVDVLDQGGIGITSEVFCSKSVMGMVGLRVDEKPATRTWNTLLARLGYQQHEKLVWWNGSSQRVWTKRPLNINEIKEILDKTLNPIK